MEQLPLVRDAIQKLHEAEKVYWQEGAATAPALVDARNALFDTIEIELERLVKARTPVIPRFDAGWSCWNCDYTSVLPKPVSELEAVCLRSAACTHCGAVSEYRLVYEDEVLMDREWDKPEAEPFYTIPGLICYRDGPKLPGPEAAALDMRCSARDCKQDFVHHVVTHHSENEHEGNIFCCRHTGEALRTIRGTHVDGQAATRCDQLPTCDPDDLRQCDSGMDCTTPAAHMLSDADGVLAAVCCKHARADLKTYEVKISKTFGDCWGLSSCKLSS